ncbi:hypothetical protein Zmor_001245 [Zophobas morio]|uniref:Sodium channel protein Nach n=1 Tax=Zophobas morio TaxID=2755281 RepID=A0AA38J0R6_9CUCU|nr:hypothetical protein Zmor_001245 [Zophobas morio]
MHEANKNAFGDIASSHLPKLEHFVFFDGTMRYIEACDVGGAFRDRCILNNYSEYMTKFRSSCSEIIGSCYYNGVEFPCCDEFLSIGTYHGPCFAFNSLFSGKYKTRDQLSFKINRNTDYGYGNLSVELLHTGLLVYGLSQDAVPTKDSSRQYVLVNSASKSIVPATYYKAFLSVEETFTDENARLMSIENRGCRFYDENHLQHSKIYSMSTCENDCLVEAQRSVCNCTVHTLPHNKEVRDCDYDGLLCIIDNALIAQKSRSCRCVSSCFDVEVKIIGFTNSTGMRNEM